MSTGQFALRAILESRDLRAFRELEAGLFTPQEAPALDFITRYVQRHGALPEMGIVNENGIALARSRGGNVSYHMERLRERALFQEVTPELTTLTAAMGARNMGVVKTTIQSMAAKVRDRDTGSVTSQIGRVVADLHAELNRHEALAPGVPYGYRVLDENTSGMQPGDLAVLVGRTNVGKSFYLLNMLMAGWKAYRTPLVITMEMNVRQLAERMVGLHTGINTRFIRDRRLSTQALNNIAETVTDFQLLPPLTFVSGHKLTSVELVEALIIETQPCAVYIDAAYLLKVAGRQNAKWETIAAVMEALQAMAERTGVPILITVQFNRNQSSKSDNLENAIDRVGGSDAISQLAAVLVAIAPMSGVLAQTRRVLRLDKNRHGPKGIQWHTKFEFTPMSFDEVEVEAQTRRANLSARMV